MPRLRRVQPYVSPGYRRIRRGTGFEYRHVAGGRRDVGDPVDDDGPVGRAERRRLDELAVPPAWREVWIAEAPNAHILAVGVDDLGRRQYLYHPAWRERRDAEKFVRMQELARAMPGARQAALEALDEPERTKSRALAAAFRTLDLGALRVGSEEYLASARTRGLTTLLVRNASVDGETVRLRFRAKGGTLQRIALDEPRLARFIESGAHRPEARLFTWRSEHGLRAISPSEVNDELRARTGGDFTAKDVRTLRGTLAAAVALADAGPASSARKREAAIRAAHLAASEVLHNTPAVARSSYVDPRIVTAYEQGRVLEADGQPELALDRLIAGRSS
ncbi:DNA topoisomerase IB [Agromyces soli]